VGPRANVDVLEKIKIFLKIKYKESVKHTLFICYLLLNWLETFLYRLYHMCRTSRIIDLYSID